MSLSGGSNLKYIKKEKLILICVAIIAISIIVSQVIKQSSIERQGNAKLEQDRQALEYQKEQDRKIEADKAYNKIMLNACLKDAEDNYWNYAELNGTGKRDDEEGVSMAQYKWDIAEKNKQKDIENCYRKYPNK